MPRSVCSSWHFPGAWLTWDDPAAHRGQMWVTADESRADIVNRYRQAWEHSDATIAALAIDAPGHVLWWPRPNVKLFNVMVHVLTETSRHAGHADILREQLDGNVGTTEGSQMKVDQSFWEARRAKIEQAAKAADPQPRLTARLGSNLTVYGWKTSAIAIDPFGQVRFIVADASVSVSIISNDQPCAV